MNGPGNADSITNLYQFLNDLNTQMINQQLTSTDQRIQSILQDMTLDPNKSVDNKEDLLNTYLQHIFSVILKDAVENCRFEDALKALSHANTILIDRVATVEDKQQVENLLKMIQFLTTGIHTLSDIKKEMYEIREKTTEEIKPFRETIDRIQEHLKKIKKLSDDELSLLAKFFSFNPEKGSVDPDYKETITDFNEFLDECQKLKEVNEKQLYYPTNAIPSFINDPRAEKLIRLYATILPRFSQWQSYLADPCNLEDHRKAAEQRKNQADNKVVTAIFHTLLERAYPLNTQFNSDNLLMHNIVEIPDKRSSTFERAKNHTELMELSEDNCIQRHNSLLFHGVSWRNVERFEAGGVKKATRQIILTAPTGAREERNVELDLTPLGNLNDKQTCAILQFMANIEDASSRPGAYEWIHSKVLLDSWDKEKTWWNPMSSPWIWNAPEKKEFPANLNEFKDKLAKSFFTDKEAEEVKEEVMEEIMNIAAIFIHKTSYAISSAMIKF